MGIDSLFERHQRWWCHLLCDDFSLAGLAELHHWAGRIGAPQRAFHNPPGRLKPHYDLTPELRASALELGVITLTRRQVGEWLLLGRSRASLDSKSEAGAL